MSKDIVSKEIILDVIPIYENEMYPTSEGIWHYRNERIEQTGKIIDIEERKIHEQIHIEKMIYEIKRQFDNADAIIIIRDGLVIKVINNKRLE